MSRPTICEWGMKLAYETTTRATCPRRQVGCILLDYKGRVLATGYNGVPKGFDHCTDKPCMGTSDPDGCLATHAEINALIQCPNPDDVYYVVVTCFPCFRCLKALLNTGMRYLVFNELYDGYAQNLWMLAERDIKLERITNGKS